MTQTQKAVTFINNLDQSVRLTNLLKKFEISSIDDIIQNIDSLCKFCDKKMRVELIILLKQHDVDAEVFMQYCWKNPSKKNDFIMTNKVLKTVYNNNWAVEEYVYLTDSELNEAIETSTYTVEEIDGSNYHNGDTYHVQGRIISPMISGCGDCPLRTDNSDGCHTSYSYWDNNPRPCDELHVYVVGESE